VCGDLFGCVFVFKQGVFGPSNLVSNTRAGAVKFAAGTLKIFENLACQ